MNDIVAQLRNDAYVFAAFSFGLTAAQAADEIERLRINYAHACEEADVWMAEAKKMQALIDAYAAAWREYAPQCPPGSPAHNALLAAATKKEDDRG